MDFIKDTILYLFKQLNNKDKFEVQIKLNDLMLEIKNEHDKNHELTYEKIYGISWY